MDLKIKILVLLITLFLFGGCSSEVNYSSQIINYDFHQLDGVLIYNRDIDVIVFKFFRVKASGLVLADSTCKCTTPQSYKIFS
jgi:putative lipoprotein